MCPLLNASCTARENRRAPATPASAARRGPQRMATAGPTRPSRPISSTFTPPGTSLSGKPSSAVAAELAWISAPAIRSSPEDEVGWTSCSDGDAGPTITIFPRSVEAGTLPSWTREKETVSTVRGGPA